MENRKYMGALKEKVGGKVFDTSIELEEEIEKEWKNFSKEKCGNMMNEVSYRLHLVIENNGEHGHKY
jgi:hypothetical protein